MSTDTRGTGTAGIPAEARIPLQRAAGEDAPEHAIAARVALGPSGTTLRRSGSAPRQPAEASLTSDRPGEKQPLPTGSHRRSRGRKALAIFDLTAAAAGATALLVLTGSGSVRWQEAVLALGVSLLWVTALSVNRCYESWLSPTSAEAMRRIARSATWTIAATGVVSLLLGWVDLGRFLVSALVLAGLISVLARRTTRLWIHRNADSPVATRRVLVVGTERAAAEFVRRFQQRKDHGHHVVGVVVDKHTDETIEGIPVAGPSADTLQAVANTGADTVAIAAWSHLSQADVRRLVCSLGDTDVDIVVAPNVDEVSHSRLAVDVVAGLPLLHVRKPELTGVRRWGKAIFDRGLAALALVLTLPLIVAIGIAVRLETHGPVIFRQTRIGRDSRPFTMLKIRSMVKDAEEQLDLLAPGNLHDEGPLFKLISDPRVTRVGAFLRRTSLDELPQLWNVLIGQMSLVGPRPPLPQEVSAYDSDATRRLLVKPGITGLWQVSGRSDLDWSQSLHLDLYYVENWSPLLDLRIILRTFHAVVQARGAY